MIGQFIEAYNREWLIERHGHRTPVEVRQALTKKRGVIKPPTCPRNPDRYTGADRPDKMRWRIRLPLAMPLSP